MNSSGVARILGTAVLKSVEQGQTGILPKKRSSLFLSSQHAH